MNAVLPGLVETPLTITMTENVALMEDLHAIIVLARPADPKEIARPLLFLASDEAEYIIGTSRAIDGVWEITGYPNLAKHMG